LKVRGSRQKKKGDCLKGSVKRVRQNGKGYRLKALPLVTGLKAPGELVFPDSLCEVGLVSMGWFDRWFGCLFG
jgi:hypothetical protein